MSKKLTYWYTDPDQRYIVVTYTDDPARRRTDLGRRFSLRLRLEGCGAGPWYHRIRERFEPIRPHRNLYESTGELGAYLARIPRCAGARGPRHRPKSTAGRRVQRRFIGRLDNLGPTATIREVADCLGLSYSTIYRWVHMEGLAAGRSGPIEVGGGHFVDLPPGGPILIDMEALRESFKSRRKLDL